MKRTNDIHAETISTPATAATITPATLEVIKAEESATEQIPATLEERNATARKDAAKAALAAYTRGKTPADIVRARCYSFEWERETVDGEHELVHETAYATGYSLLSKDAKQAVKDYLATIIRAVALIERERNTTNAPKPNRNKAKETLVKIANIYGFDGEYKCDNSHINMLVSWATTEKKSGNVSDTKVATGMVKKVESVFANWANKHTARVFIGKEEFDFAAADTTSAAK